MQNLFSKAVIVFSGFVFLALLGLNISNHVYYTESLGSIAYHYAAPSVLAAVVLACLRLSAAARLSLALCLVSVVFAFYAAELYLTFETDRRLDQAARSNSGVFDTRSKIQVINDLRQAGDDAYPVMRAKSILLEKEDGTLIPALKVKGEDFLPLASVPDKTVVACNESGRWMIYKSDRHGFHNPSGTWDASPLKIAIVGDSFAHGNCVPAGRDTAGWLRKDFGRVLNLGVSGFGPFTELASIVEYAAPMKPEVVLWFYFEGNDLTEDIAYEKRSPILMKYFKEDGFSQGLIDRRDEVSIHLKAYLDERLIEAMNRFDDPNEDLMNFLKLYHLRELLGLGTLSLGILDGGGTMEDLKLFGRVLEKSRRLVESWGGRLYFVFLPGSERYFVSARDNDIREYLRRKVLETVAGLKIPLIDVDRAFTGQPDPRALFQYPGSHFNIQGYKVTAEAVKKALSAAE